MAWQQFLVLKPNGTQEVGKQMCRDVPSTSRTSSATYSSDQSASGELTSNNAGFISHSRIAAIILNYTGLHWTLAPDSRLLAAVLLRMYSVPAIL